MNKTITVTLLAANLFFAAWGWATEHYFTALINSAAVLFLTYMLASED